MLWHFSDKEGIPERTKPMYDVKKSAKKIREEKGMISLEMILMLSMYVMVFAGVMVLINGFIIQYRLQRAVNQTAKETAAYAETAAQGTGTAYMIFEAFHTIGLDGWEDDETDWTFALCQAADRPSNYYANVISIYRFILIDMYPDIDEYLKSHGVGRGIQDLRLEYSYFRYDGDLTVTLTYNFHWLKVPFSDKWLGGKRIVCSASTRAWRP